MSVQITPSENYLVRHKHSYCFRMKVLHDQSRPGGCRTDPVRAERPEPAYGVCDIITHVAEGYFTGIDGTPIQDRFAEGVIINAMEWGRKAVVDGSDLEARTRCSGRLSLP